MGLRITTVLLSPLNSLIIVLAPTWRTKDHYNQDDGCQQSYPATAKLHFSGMFRSESWTLALCVMAFFTSPVSSFAPTKSHRQVSHLQDQSSSEQESDSSSVFADFVEFLKDTQASIIEQVEELDGSGVEFSNDKWGVFEDDFDGGSLSGGRTRVIQGGDIVEKGACSLTLIRRGILSAERAAAIRSRQDLDIQPGDVYSAAALSIVLHSRSPMVPTFRSDVRIFLVESESDKTTMAWFGGGADLTPYFLFDEDVTFFHNMVRIEDGSVSFSPP